MMQPDLIPHPRPPELIVAGRELIETLATIKHQGGKVTAMERLDKHSTKWRLFIYWLNVK